MQKQLITIYRPNGMLGLGSENNMWLSYNVSYKRSRKLLVARANEFALGKPYLISVWRISSIYTDPDFVFHSDDADEWCEYGSVQPTGIHYRNNKWSKWPK